MYIFDNTMKKCKVKINDNIFFRGWSISFKNIALLKLQLENSPSAYSKLCIPNRRKHENPMDDWDRGQSRSTVGQNLHILYITGHLYDLDGYEKWRGFGLCRWRPLGFSFFFLSLMFTMQIGFSHLTLASWEGLLQPYTWGFWAGRYTVWSIALKFSIAYRASFAQLLVKKKCSSGQVTKLSRHKRNNLRQDFSEMASKRNLAWCEWLEWV